MDKQKQKLWWWVPPRQGTVKLNFDGGLSGQRGCAVSGGIFRDHQGLPLFSYTCAGVELGSTPYEAEAKALEMGLVYARNLGFSSLWVEGDALYLIDAVEGRRRNQWYNEGTVQFIRSMMDAGFPQRPALTWVAREANSAADALVKHARDGVSSVLETRWYRGAMLPPTVAAVVDRERNGYSYTRRRCYNQRHAATMATLQSS